MFAAVGACASSLSSHGAGLFGEAAVILEEPRCNRVVVYRRGGTRGRFLLHTGCLASGVHTLPPRSAADASITSSGIVTEVNIRKVTPAAVSRRARNLGAGFGDPSRRIVIAP